jgi:hypothetical protein
MCRIDRRQQQQHSQPWRPNLGKEGRRRRGSSCRRVRSPGGERAAVEQLRCGALFPIFAHMRISVTVSHDGGDADSEWAA